MIPQHARTFRLDAPTKLFGDPALADAGLSAEQHHLPFADTGLLPALLQQGELALAAGHCRESAGDSCFEPTLAPDGDRPVRQDRLLDSFYRLTAKRLELEAALDQTLGGVRQQHIVRLSDSLQSRSKVGGFSQDGPLLRSALPDDVSSHDQPGRDADTHLQRHANVGSHGTDGVDHRQARSYGALSVVLVGLRVSEVHQQSVAHVTRDVAVVRSDCAARGVLIRGEHIPIRFRI